MLLYAYYIMSGPVGTGRSRTVSGVLHKAELSSLNFTSAVVSLTLSVGSDACSPFTRL